MERIKSDFITLLSKNIIASVSLISLILLMIVQLTWPYDIDHTIFAGVGETILNGGMPYKDAWELKGPAVYYIFAFINWLFNNQEYGLRIFDLICSSFGFIIFYKICNRLSGPFISIILLSVFGSFYFHDNWVAAEPDGWASFLTLSIVYLLLKDNGNFRNRNTTYIAIIIAILTCLKPPFILYSLLIPIYTLFWRDANNKDKLIFVIKTALISIFLLSLVAFYFWINNALQELIDILFIYNIEFHRDIWGISNQKNVLTGLTRIFALDNFVALYPLFLIGIFLLLKKEKRLFIIIFSYLCISTLIIVIQNSYLDYHHLLIVPPVLLFTSITLDKYKNKFIIYLLCVSVIYLSFHDKYSKYFLSAYDLSTNKISASEYRERIILINDKKLWEVVRYMETKNSEKRPVFVLGFEQGINFFSESPTATRFTYIMAFIESHGEYFQNISKILLEDLSKSNPKYIILTPYTEYISRKNRNRNEAIDRIKGLKSYIDNKYKIDNVIFPFFIYKEKDNINNYNPN